MRYRFMGTLQVVNELTTEEAEVAMDDLREVIRSELTLVKVDGSKVTRLVDVEVEETDGQ